MWDYPGYLGFGNGEGHFPKDSRMYMQFKTRLICRDPGRLGEVLYSVDWTVYFNSEGGGLFVSLDGTGKCGGSVPRKVPNREATSK
jgi:hypothetical protein